MNNTRIATDIDIAAEIAYATLMETVANMDNERIVYVLMGVLQQIEIIKKSVNDFDLKGQDNTSKKVA